MTTILSTSIDSPLTSTVTTIAELNDVLVQVAGMTSGDYEIDLGANATIALTTALEAINLQSGVTLAIKGNGATLDGQNTQRGLFVYSGIVAVDDLTLANTKLLGVAATAAAQV
jgi:hypothetical protein